MSQTPVAEPGALHELWRCGDVVPWSETERAALSEDAWLVADTIPPLAACAGGLAGLGMAGLAGSGWALLGGANPSMVAVAVACACALSGWAWGAASRAEGARWIDEKSRSALERASVAWERALMERENLSSQDAVRAMVELSQLAQSMAQKSLAGQARHDLAARVGIAPEALAARLACERLESGPAPQPQPPSRLLQWTATVALRQFSKKKSLAAALPPEDRMRLAHHLPGSRALALREDLGQACSAARPAPRSRL